MDVFSNSFFITLTLVGAVFSFAGWMLVKFPPRKINFWYGYRTKRSMKNKESWDFAQKYSGDLSLRYGVTMVLIAFAGLYLPLSGLWAEFLALPVMFLFIIMMLVKVERALEEEFGE